MRNLDGGGLHTHAFGNTRIFGAVHRAYGGQTVAVVQLHSNAGIIWPFFTVFTVPGSILREESRPDHG